MRDRFSNFDRDFNRTRRMVGFMFVFVILLKLAILALIIWAGVTLYHVGFDGLGEAIGSFIGSVERGMEQ